MESRKKKSVEEMIMDIFLDEVRSTPYFRLYPLVTFDLEYDNPDELTNIRRLIAAYLLRDWPYPVGYAGALDEHAEAVGKHLSSAIRRLRDEHGILVYKGPGDSIQIKFLTSDSKYRNAKWEDLKRQLMLQKFDDVRIKQDLKAKHPNGYLDTKDVLQLPEAHEALQPEAPEEK